MQLSSLKYNNKLDSSPSIQAYNNDFKLLSDQLHMDKEKWSKWNLKKKYLLNIQATEGSLIMAIKTLCVADNTFHYKETAENIFKTALHNDFDQDEQQRVRYRGLPDHFKGDTKSDGATPSVPGHILDLIRKGTGQQVAGLFLKWKKLSNEEKRYIRPNELRLNDTRESNHINNNKNNSKDGKRRVGNHNNDNKGNKHLKNDTFPLVPKTLPAVRQDEPLSRQERPQMAYLRPQQ